MPEKDYIIFEHAPTITFNTTSPLECEGDFESVPQWYSSQTRDTPKPRPKIFGSITTTCENAQHVLQNIRANISVHGNYTAYYRKKSFKLHLDNARNLFGLNNGDAANDWLLMADYGDNSMLRNAVALYMGQQFFRGVWSATFTFVHVYINDEYYGLYLLTDAKKVAPSRVNINKPAEGYTGVDIGYFFERDDYLTYDHKDPGFVIPYPEGYQPSPLPVINHATNKSYGVDATYKDEYSISSDISTDDQIAFLNTFTSFCYTIMYEACINNQYYELESTDLSRWFDWKLVPSQLTDPIEVISKVVDINSFVDMYLLQEIAGNPDLAHSSFYMCVDFSPNGDKKLKLCCPWDFDRAFGISNGLMNARLPRLWAKDAHYNPWISLLPQADWFIELLKTRYQELSTNGIFTKLSDMLDDYSTTYEDDFAQNYARYDIKWTNDFGGWVPNGSPATIGTLNASYYQQINTEAEAKSLLKTWINNRVATLASIFGLELPEVISYQNNLLAKDYTIFDHVPTITFTCDTPFSCEEDLYNNFSDWYTNINEHSASRPRISGKISVTNCPINFELNNLEAALKIRGNYTPNYSKKPFQIRFNKKQNLLGLNNGQKNKKWVLLADYNDSSMLRNATAFYMGKHVFSDTDVWVPTFTYVHFRVVAGDRIYYQGIYLLVDNKEQNPERVNVFEPEDDEYQGTDIGYFFERDDYYQRDDDPTFFIEAAEYQPVGPVKIDTASNSWSRHIEGIPLNGDGYSIHSKVTCDAQVNFLKQRVLCIYNILYDAVYSQQYYALSDDNEFIELSTTNPVEALNQTIDLKTFIDMYIFQNIVCNPDLGHSSFYLSLDMSESGDKRLRLCCPWDYDLSMGLAKGFAEDPMTDGDYAKSCTLNYWVSILPDAPWFMDLVHQRWQELWNSAFPYRSLRMLNDYSSTYINDFALNFTEWSITWVTDGNKTWNLDGRSFVISGYEIFNGAHPKKFVRADYYTTDICFEQDCKVLFEEWLIERFKALQLLWGFDNLNFVLPAIAVPDSPGIYICINDNNNYRLKKVKILGADEIRTCLHDNITDQAAEEIIYKLRNLKFTSGFMLDLETGGNYLPEFDGYENWFPGSDTFGLVKNTTAIYNQPEAAPEYATGQAIIVSGAIPKEQYIVEILEIIDDIDVDLDLRRRLKPMWHIKMFNGYEGYINANNISDIFYRPRS